VHLPAVDADICEHAVILAERLLTTAIRQQTRSECAQAAKLGRLMDDPAGKAFTFAMVDEVFRSSDALHHDAGQHTLRGPLGAHN